MKNENPSLKSPEIQAKLQKIKLLILDVDGILTDCSIFWQEENGWTRIFSIKDGYGMKLLMLAGVHVAVISAGSSEDVKKRMQFLGVQDIFLGKEDKLIAFEKLLKKYDLKEEETAYMGDELFDLPVLRRVGFSATVPEAAEEVLAEVDYITQRTGGKGAVREVIDGIRKVQGIVPEGLGLNAEGTKTQ
jgi:3-deoxy-D-manno-octulosonate 8-phosphate phosphatase (KDO 8-P phosphatase)